MKNSEKVKNIVFNNLQKSCCSFKPLKQTWCVSTWCEIITPAFLSTTLSGFTWWWNTRRDEVEMLKISLLSSHLQKPDGDGCQETACGSQVSRDNRFHKCWLDRRRELDESCWRRLARLIVAIGTFTCTLKLWWNWGASCRPERVYSTMIDRWHKVIPLYYMAT